MTPHSKSFRGSALSATNTITMAVSPIPASPLWNFIVPQAAGTREGFAMTLHINEAEVRAMLTMAMAMEAVEEVSRKQSTGEVVVHPRRRFELPGGGFFHYMAAADYSGGHIAMKQY